MLPTRFLGFKGNGESESVLFVFNGGVSVDPYSREEQANFAKWYAHPIYLATVALMLPL
jgi:hypothetical protein